jgi:hypothetical protein
MSVRAYRIITKEVAEEPSFNLWHDDELLDFLMGKDGYDERLSEDGGGTINISVELLEKAVKKLKWEDEDDKKAIEHDIAEAKKVGDDWIEYECY